MATPCVIGTPGRLGAAMSFKPFDADALVEAAAEMLQLKIPAEQRDGVKNQLKTAAKMAALVEQVKLADDAEPAPVYRA